MGSIARMDPKNTLKCRDVSWLPLQLLARNTFFQNDMPEPPLNVNLKVEVTWLMQMKRTMRLLC